MVIQILQKRSFLFEQTQVNRYLGHRQGLHLLGRPTEGAGQQIAGLRQG
jgi:hypothetical protein